MNQFMSNLLEAIGTEVSGSHGDKPFLGRIVDSKPKRDFSRCGKWFGKDIQITVACEDTNELFFIDGIALLNGKDSSFSNLHVYF